jgi:hypothetical protein
MIRSCKALQLNGCAAALFCCGRYTNFGNVLLTFRVQVARRRVYTGDNAGAPAGVKTEMSITMAESEEPLRVPPTSNRGKLATRWLFLLFCGLVWVIGAIWFFS